jgi:3D (Asp-Asp-Asp) domain-containing protein
MLLTFCKKDTAKFFTSSNDSSMRERWIDVALMLGLFVVAGVIVWTLFGAPTPKLQSASTPQVTPTEPSVVTPVNPGETTTSEVIEPAILENSDGVATTVEPEDTEIIEETLIELPEGTLELNRIGFSYVTGGSGACGMVLEPWKHVAVSRDILERYPCGSSISVHLDKAVADRDNLTAIVGDTMNPIHQLTVNIYVGTDEPALKYGVRGGQLIP